jgi:amidase
MFRHIKAALAPNIEPELPPAYYEGIQAARKLSFTSSDFSNPPEFEPLTTTAFELSELLNAQAITSVEIVETYLRQIEQHNRRGRQLRALISVAPKHELLKIARKLDAERARGKRRGPLHGVPVVLKDNIMTDASLGMDTTVGTYIARWLVLSTKFYFV